MSGWEAVLAAIVPSIGVGALFWLALRALMNADAKERRVEAELRAAERAARGESGADRAHSD
jgi:Tfp pilus assembly protein PilV